MTGNGERSIEEAAADRDRAGRIVRTLAYVIAAVVLVTTALSLAYLVSVAGKLDAVTSETHRAASQVADCTTPHGTCYERSQKQGAAAVKQIIDALDALEVQRGRTSAKLAAGQEQIRAALRQLCAAQHITCPTAR